MGYMGSDCGLKKDQELERFVEDPLTVREVIGEFL